MTEKDWQKEPAPSEAYYFINEEAARRAKEAMSFSDYKMGSATAEYRQYVDEAVAIAERQKKRVDPMHHEKIDSLLDTYARKLAANMNKGNEIAGRVPSIMIAGGSNFPVRKKEKQNAAADRNMEEYREIQGLLDKIRSTGMGGISADDPQAVEKLQKKLSGLEKSQETMKAVNAYYRKHKTLDGCPHLPPEQIEKLKADMSSQWHLADKPFASWALSNNSAEIRRVKERIKSLSQQKEIGYAGWEFADGKVEANTEANRLQIFFNEKPGEATRAELKASGFRWSPKAGAWQRQLTDNAYYAANRVKAIAPLTGEEPTEIQRAHIGAAKENTQPPQEAAKPAGEDKDAMDGIKDKVTVKEKSNVKGEKSMKCVVSGRLAAPAKVESIVTKDENRRVKMASFTIFAADPNGPTKEVLDEKTGEVRTYNQGIALNCKAWGENADYIENLKKGEMITGAATVRYGQNAPQFVVTKLDKEHQIQKQMSSLITAYSSGEIDKLYEGEEKAPSFQGPDKELEKEAEMNQSMAHEHSQEQEMGME